VLLCLQCATNGLNPTKLAQEGPQCSKLEMFFFGYDRLVGLQHFPNLQVLSVVGQMIDRIKGLTQVPLLTELWIAECQLRVRLNSFQDVMFFYYV
jgi:hypothetical protein